MKSIETLGQDIYDVLRSRDKGDAEEEAKQMESFGVNVALSLNKAMHIREDVRKPYRLWASELGKPCRRQLWYAHRVPELTEALQPHTKFKFLYGDLIEETVLTLAEAAGHRVEGKQDAVEYKYEDWTVSGRQDAIIDGVLVDVKSASTYSYRKFDAGLNDTNDSFGYRQQLSFYNGVEMPAYSTQGFVAIDKQNGHIGFFKSEWVNNFENVKRCVNAIEGDLPPQHKDSLEDASFGNKKLSTMCSYCPFKKVCFEQLEMAVYSTGPQFLPTPLIKKAPKVSMMSYNATDTERMLVHEARMEPYGC